MYLLTVGKLCLIEFCGFCSLGCWCVCMYDLIACLCLGCHSIHVCKNHIAMAFCFGEYVVVVSVVI